MCQSRLSLILILVIIVSLSVIGSSAYADDPGSTIIDTTAIDSANNSCPCTGGAASVPWNETPVDTDVQKGLPAGVFADNNETGGIESLLTREVYDKITNVSRYYHECWERSRALRLKLPS
jgi:hypothetical protein